MFGQTTEFAHPPGWANSRQRMKRCWNPAAGVRGISLTIRRRVYG